MNLSSLEDLKFDQDLRPLFLDFISKNLTLGLSDIFIVKSVDRARLKRDYYVSLHVLSEKLNEYLPNDEINLAIEEVSKYYLSENGRLIFEQYPSHSDN